MTPRKPHFRFDYRRAQWLAVYYTFEGYKTGGRSFPAKSLLPCEICGGPAVKRGLNTLCDTCSDARRAEIIKQRQVFVNARNSGKIGHVDGLQCVDCAPDFVTSKRPATEWEHRDWREPLKVEPICRMHNTRRGRAMTAYEASFSQRTNDALKPLHVDPICQPHQRVSDESAGARQSLPT